MVVTVGGNSPFGPNEGLYVHAYALPPAQTVSAAAP
jgi:hypothetical protein